ncbi:MAG: hypothetical protein NVSMB66_3900 [Candidatus Doudnabacteria bacterium]
MNKKSGLIATSLLLVGLLAAGCDNGTSSTSNSAPQNTTASNSAPQNTTVSADPNDAVASKAADLRVLLNGLDKEHVALALNATREGFDGRPDFNAIAKALDSNTQALGDSVGSVYGADAETKFLQLWRNHIQFFVDYTVASKKHDQAGMDKAKKGLAGYSNDIADFLSGANPNLPREAVFQIFSDHINVLLSSIDAYSKGDYANAYAQQHAGTLQVQKAADALAGAIVKQYPDKFR